MRPHWSSELKAAAAALNGECLDIAYLRSCTLAELGDVIKQKGIRKLIKDEMNDFLDLLANGVEHASDSGVSTGSRAYVETAE